jgi:hypothetical protein
MNKCDFVFLYKTIDISFIDAHFYSKWSENSLDLYK